LHEGLVRLLTDRVDGLANLRCSLPGGTSPRSSRSKTADPHADYDVRAANASPATWQATATAPPFGGRCLWSRTMEPGSDAASVDGTDADSGTCWGSGFAAGYGVLDAITRTAGTGTALDGEVFARLLGLEVAKVFWISCGLFAD